MVQAQITLIECFERERRRRLEELRQEYFSIFFFFEDEAKALRTEGPEAHSSIRLGGREPEEKRYGK